MVDEGLLLLVSLIANQPHAIRISYSYAVTIEATERNIHSLKVKETILINKCNLHTISR